jgi:hypothetical protein
MAFRLPVSCLAVAGALLVVTAGPVQAKSIYDGLWSVLIITEHGNCDRGYRYGVRIRSGVVAHADPANSSFTIRGRVARGGVIRVSVARAGRSAIGTGRMTRNTGGGKWHSSKGECSGQWKAERRGT